ncbi:hypothetical protein M569_13216 [Genlisea aurea]|uniref:Uncharacterized protein n=1 Tax=Genlisea aurea TaxID=192259 RepID=S8C4J9_9LAMI|nr:hypothetical protein M569_13216 [Genlisea aurea]
MQCTIPLRYLATRDDRDRNEAAFSFVPGYVLHPPWLYTNSNDKWRIGWIMQSHEATFKHQVQELHRVYERQRDLMNELKLREHSHIHQPSSDLLRLPPPPPPVREEAVERRKWLAIDLNQQPPELFSSEEEEGDHDTAKKFNSSDGLNGSMVIDLNSLPAEEEDHCPLIQSAAETLVTMMRIEDCVLQWFADIAAATETTTTAEQRNGALKRSCRKTRRLSWGEKRKRGASSKKRSKLSY